MSLCPKEHWRPTSAGRASPSNRHHLHLGNYHHLPQISIIFIIGCTQIFIIPVIIFILESIQIVIITTPVIVTNRHNVDVDANQLGHRAEKRGQEASLSSKARQGRPGSQARQDRPGQKKLRKKRRGTTSWLDLVISYSGHVDAYF